MSDNGKNSIQPRVVVFSSLFPHPGQPNAGVFIRERMFRVGKQLPLVVVAPVPWFPFQGLLRRWKPHFRPPAPRHERQDGFDVYHPRFFCIPGLFKWMDGLFMAMGSFATLQRLHREFGFNLIDAHFGYPDGRAATLLSRWLVGRIPVTITLRGTEVPHARSWSRRPFLKQALKDATRLFAVSSSLKQQAMALGVPADKVRVVGNGVDTDKFFPADRAAARQRLGLPERAKVLITVGGLVERKGFHRVLEVMPGLLGQQPDLHYLIVGGPCAEGDWSERLRQQAQDLGLDERVHFLGAMPSEELRGPLSAADVFVLATRNEGWANVLLEAMACGLPVVATDVGGNVEVVSKPELGRIVPFGEPQALRDALAEALGKNWDREAIIAHARANSWEQRVAVLIEEFTRLVNENGTAS